MADLIPAWWVRAAKQVDSISMLETPPSRSHSRYFNFSSSEYEQNAPSSRAWPGKKKFLLILLHTSQFWIGKYLHKSHSYRQFFLRQCEKVALVLFQWVLQPSLDQAWQDSEQLCRGRSGKKDTNSDTIPTPLSFWGNSNTGSDICST